MLIKGGWIHTMTQQGSFRGDILVSGGKIRQVAAQIDPPEGVQILEADGLTVLPGLIDPFVGSGGSDTKWLTACMLRAGVTTGLLAPEEGNACRLLTRDGTSECPMALVDPDLLTEDGFADSLADCIVQRKTPVCQIRSADACRRALGLILPGTVLVGLQGCESLSRQIARTGAAAVIGVMKRTENPWRMAVSLASEGVPVALSCLHPGMKFPLLTVCAGLCVREGMDRAAALSAITDAPARIIGLSDRGCIRQGCIADLTLWDGDPLLMATSLVMSIAGGRILRHGATG